MKLLRRLVPISLVLALPGFTPPVQGQGSDHAQQAFPFVASSSRSGDNLYLPDAPETATVVGRRDRSPIKLQYQTHIRPFSRTAFAFKVGLEGFGVDVATPLSNKWNLRAGASFLNANIPVTVQQTSTSFGLQQSATINVDARPRFRNIMATLDWFPRYGSLRISPGLTLYNGNRGTAIALVGGGEVLSVGDGNYTSNPSDPLRANVVLSLGNKVAPRLTIGWGNMIPRAGQHLSFPIEIGVEYIGRPTLQLSLAGSECDIGGSCYPIELDSSTYTNLQQEQQTLNQDLAPLRFYPILTTGFSYRF